MTTSTKFKRLSEPTYIGKVRLKNRMMKNGTGLFWDDPKTGGFMNDRYIAYFEALAKGGAGLVVSATSPLQEGPLPGFRIMSDDYIPGYRKLAKAIRKYDCPAFLQLFHLGGMSPLFFKAPPGVSASSIPKNESPRPYFEVAREITIPEIQEVVEKFAKAAERTKKAGFDGTELNGGCNHLLNSFLSRAWNKRQDEYGCQTMETRARIVVEIIKEIKRLNGKDWPIIALMNGMEVDLKDGITIEESKQFAKMFEEAGADAIEIRAEYYTWTKDVKRRDSTHFPDMYFYPEHPSPLDECVEGKGEGAGANLPMAAEIKKAVSVPVIVMGKMDWEMGEKAIRKGKVDIISMNRRLFADPELPKKVLEGRIEDINPCTSCMTCFNLGEHFQPVACRVNPSFGHEREYEIKPAKKKKKVMIIGGGPAGMEAARVAALRGHEVILYDKESKLGGSLPVAAMIKGREREDLVGFIRYLKRQVNKLGVTIKLGKEVSPQIVEDINPDVLILAAGGKHNIPDIPGINGSNVLTGMELHRRLKFYLKFAGPELLRKLSSIWLPFIGKNVIIMGGRLHGCQTAEFLVKRGRKVTIVDTGTEKEIGDGLIEVFLKPYLLYWLADKGVEIITEAKYKEINKKGLIITTKEGNERTIKVNTIVTALPLEPNTELVNSMQRKAKEVYAIGDAKEPHLIIDAMADGARIGREI
jgi:2,4-dienoyl-CoA reductase (NADPH2)